MWNILSWEGPTRITVLAQDISKSHPVHPWELCPAFLELWQPWECQHSLGSLGSAPHPLEVELSLKSNLNLPVSFVSFPGWICNIPDGSMEFQRRTGLGRGAHGTRNAKKSPRKQPHSWKALGCRQSRVYSAARIIKSALNMGWGNQIPPAKGNSPRGEETPLPKLEL